MVTKDWSGIIQAASKSPLGILALLILVMGSLGVVFFKNADAKIKAVIYLAMLAGVIGYGAAVVRANSGAAQESSYRVRVNVLDEHQTPVDDAKVWSSIGGEPSTSAGAWTFVIPRDTKPADGKVTFYASKDSAFLKGQAVLQLADDHNPNVTVALEKSRTAKVMGIVVDERGSAIVGATVSVIGYDSEFDVTKASGSFSLPAHAADGQQVRLHTEKPGYRADTRLCMAGDSSITIDLKRN